MLNNNYLCLFTILVSYFPVSTSIYLTKRDTLFSSLRLVQIVSVKLSMSSGMDTGSGSPSKLGSGFPSSMYVLIKCPVPAAAGEYVNYVLIKCPVPAAAGEYVNVKR